MDTLSSEPALLTAILDQLKTVVDYDDAAFFEVEGKDLTTLAYRGVVSEAGSLLWGSTLEALGANRELNLPQMPLVIPDVRDSTSQARALQRVIGDQLETVWCHVRCWMSIPLTDGERMTGLLGLCHRKAGYYTSSHVTLVQAFVQENASSIRHAMLHASALRRVDELQTVLDIQRGITSHLDLDAVLHTVAAEARRLTASRVASVYLLEHDHLRQVACMGQDGPLPIDELPVALDASLSGEALRSGSLLRSLDVEHDARVCLSPGRCPEAHSLATVPLCSGGQAIGALLVVDKLLGTFGPHDERVLISLAQAAVVGIENARLYARAEEISRLEERQRIAQTLHETLAQMLFTIGLEVKQCLDRPSLEEDVRQTLCTITRLAERSSHELRSAIFALRRREFARESGPIALLQERVEEFQTETGIATTLIAPPQTPTLPPLINEAAYGVVTEALTNVRKHAQASAVVVNLHCDAGWVTVTIQDDGIGLADPSVAEADGRDLHFGIQAMRRLVEQAHGQFLIANNDDRGVTVRARLPISSEPAL
jgi:signal transduction histidine kinase